jgi:nicotinamide phosphoribosyltransferase
VPLQVVPVVASKKVEAGGFWVLRPDSGDPVEVVLQVSRMVDCGECGGCCFNT